MPHQSADWLGMTVLTRVVALGWGVPRYGGRGESCCRGNGQRQRSGSGKLWWHSPFDRQRHTGKPIARGTQGKFAAGRSAPRESKTVGFGGVLSHLSFAIERKVTAGGKHKKGFPRLRRGDGGTDCRTSDVGHWFAVTGAGRVEAQRGFCTGTATGERIAAPVTSGTGSE